MFVMTENESATKPTKNRTLKYVTAAVIVVGILLIGSGLIFAHKSPNSSILKDNSANQANATSTEKIKINDAVVSAEVVDTEAAMELGLGGRNSLESGSGMWFVFSEESNYGFWMKDMKFSLDMIWFDKNLKVVGIKKDATPESYPQIFYPDSDALYVLEISAGFVENHKIKIDDQAEILN